MSGNENPAEQVKQAIHRVVKARMVGADPDDDDLTWELGWRIEGEVFDLILAELPAGKGRDLVEAVLGLVDWERVAEKATWQLADDEEAMP